MKYLVSGLALIAFVVALNLVREHMAITAIKQAGDGLEEQALKLQKQALEMQEKAKHDAWAAQKTKVFVKAKGTKECMKKLNTDVIDASVVECNKDHYVEVRNDELDEFKLKEGI